MKKEHTAFASHCHNVSTLRLCLDVLHLPDFINF